MRGLNVSVSIAIARYVLATVSASAPASSAARAKSAMSVTFGESFTMSGRRTALFSSFVKLPGQFGALAKHHAAVFRIRARDVQFIGRDSVACVQLLDDFDIFVFAEAEDIHKHRASDRLEETAFCRG